MKWIFSYLGVIAVLFIGACDSNKKLSKTRQKRRSQPLLQVTALAQYLAQSDIMAHALSMFSRSPVLSL